MQNGGLSDSSIKFASKALTYLSEHANLNKPKTVKALIANLQSGNGYKHNLCLAYDRYCDYYQIEWTKPIYRRQSRSIRIPTKEQINVLCMSASQTLSIKLRLSAETGLRPTELCNLKVRDIDYQQNRVYPTTAKSGASRILKISKSLTATIQKYIERRKLQPPDKLFCGSSDYYGKKFRMHRNRLANKLNKPELKTIRLYDFRHYFATMLYHKTKDILLVKQQLGHRRLTTTLIYTQLLNHNDNEWTCKTATNVKEATQLIESGFEYVTEIDNHKLFRKRK